MSAPDPTLGIKCVATIFGRNYNGSVDRGDNGIGAFQNAKTGRFYKTTDENLVGVSIPIPFYELTPNMSRADIESQAVTVTIQDANGEYYFNLPIVDLGPGLHGCLIKASDGPHLLDRTFGLCALMKSHDDAPVTFWIMRGGQPYAIKGQDTPYAVV
jgi:hypothetical protein